MESEKLPVNFILMRKTMKQNHNNTHKVNIINYVKYEEVKSFIGNMRQIKFARSSEIPERLNDKHEVIN